MKFISRLISSTIHQALVQLSLTKLNSPFLMSRMTVGALRVTKMMIGSLASPPQVSMVVGGETR